MAGSSAQMARTDRSRSSLRSASHESHKPPRANEKYSSMRIPLEANVGKPAVRPPSPSFRHFPSTASFRSSQRKGSSSSVRSARPPTPVSKTSMDGSLSSAHHGPQSTFLQEKLQQERRSEIQRSLTRLGDEMDTDNDAKPHSATPARPLISDGKQQDAGPGMADPKKRGLALKETEQVRLIVPRVYLEICRLGFALITMCDRQCQLYTNKILTSSWSYSTAGSAKQFLKNRWNCWRRAKTRPKKPM